MAKHGHRQWLVRIGDNLGALFEHQLRVFGQKTDQMLAVRFQHIGTRQRPLADKVRLLLANSPAKAGVVRCYCAVSILTDDDIALSARSTCMVSVP